MLEGQWVMINNGVDEISHITETCPVLGRGALTLCYCPALLTRSSWQGGAYSMLLSGITDSEFLVREGAYSMLLSGITDSEFLAGEGAYSMLYPASVTSSLLERTTLVLPVGAHVDAHMKRQFYNDYRLTSKRSEPVSETSSLCQPLLPTLPVRSAPVSETSILLQLTLSAIAPTSPSQVCTCQRDQRPPPAHSVSHCSHFSQSAKKSHLYWSPHTTLAHTLDTLAHTLDTLVYTLDTLTHTLDTLPTRWTR
uniref:Uncharacterized protein n=1 Tax=Timema bartmani TaxID=61472 RepID=A0A7R9F9S3_9NEOP|nr:unnamed protein product [Timema bartmani]